MTYWLDANLPPALAPWLTNYFGVECIALRDLNLHNANDRQIFDEAKRAQVVVIVSKDSDFVDLVVSLGKPPQVLWITCGNSSNKHLQELFTLHFSAINDQFLAGEPLIELR